MQKKTLVVASANPNKIREFSRLLGDTYNVISMREAGVLEEIEENGTTFEENARIKARAVMEKTGLPVLADDSGLEVDALDGAPGVYSARFCGHHGDDDANNRLLLKKLQGIPSPRTARYVAALAYCLPGGEMHIFRGTCEGEILHEPRGTGGFGYDPLFLCNNGQTMAEISLTEKNRFSHRAMASRMLLDFLGEEKSRAQQ